MKSNQRYIQEYIRAMNSVDVSEEMSRRLVEKCLQRVSEQRGDFKVPAIAAISCAAVAAVAAVGIPKMRNNHRK